MDEFRAGVLARVWEKVQRTARAGAVYPYVKDESLEHTLSTGVDCAAREYLRKALDITADRVPFGALGDMYIMSQKNDEHRPTLFYRMVQTIVTEQKETDLMLLQKVNNSQLQMRASTPAGGFACMLWEVCVMMEKKGGLSLDLELWEHLLEEIGDMINRWFDPDYDAMLPDAGPGSGCCCILKRSIATTSWRLGMDMSPYGRGCATQLALYDNLYKKHIYDAVDKTQGGAGAVSRKDDHIYWNIKHQIKLQLDPLRIVFSCGIMDGRFAL